MRSIISVFLVIVIISITKGQDIHEAPTLQVGLSGIKFSRGNLDAELVAEIIAEKQKEVKVKLIKNMLLNNLGVDNGLFYAFIDHSIEILTTEKDENTRVKNLLENSVNLAFVVSYAEYYIQTLKKDSPEWLSFRDLAISFGVDTSIFNNERLSLKDFAKLKYGRTASARDKIEIDGPYREELNNKFVGVIIDLFAERIRQNEQFKSIGLLRTNYLQNYSSMNAYLALENESVHKTLDPLLKNLDTLLISDKYLWERTTLEQIMNSLQSLSKVALDSSQMTRLEKYKEELKAALNISKIINENKNREDEELQLIGLTSNLNYLFFLQKQGGFNKYMLSTYNIDIPKLYAKEDKNLREQYSMMQWYLESKLKAKLFRKIFNKRDLADEVFSHVGKNLDIYLKYYGLIKLLSSRGNDWEQTLTLISDTFECGDTKSLTDSMMLQYSRARKEIADLSKLTRTEIYDLEKINSFIDKLRFAELNRYEYIRIYEKEMKPALARLSVYSSDFLNMNKSMFDLLNCISETIKDDLNKVNLNINASFIKVFTRIDEFNKGETYAEFLNQLSDAGDIFSDEEMRKSINRIITFVRSYIKMSEDTSGRLTMNLDTEGFLYNLQKTPYNRFQPLQFHFTVGANTTSFQKKLITEEEDTLANYSFIGEKIGIKFKLWDFKYARSFTKGETFTYWKFGYYGWWHLIPLPKKVTYLRTAPPKEPAVSNIHVLAYGSGILYNMVNTGTTKSFNSPIIGLGLGITFFNDLDFNVTWGKPILSGKALNDASVPAFFNFGFDIQFIEYYNRLSQKRKANKMQKKLAEVVRGPAIKE